MAVAARNSDDSPSDAYAADPIILVVDDEDDIRDVIVGGLETAGFTCRQAHSLSEAREVLNTVDVSLVFVDLGLGREDGIDLVRDLNGSPQTACLILSGRDESVEKIIGIELGADDYITKPFNIRELIARARRHLRHVAEIRALTKLIADSCTQIGEWSLNLAGRIAETSNGTRIRFSESEAKVLDELIRNRGAVTNREALYQALLGHSDFDPLDRRVDVHISNIRKKLGLEPDQILRTVHRSGYILE